MFEANAKAAVDALIVSHGGGVVMDRVTGEEREGTAAEVLAARRLQRMVRRWRRRQLIHMMIQQSTRLVDDIAETQRTRTKVKVRRMRAARSQSRWQEPGGWSLWPERSGWSW